jgi:hypothetical protein
MTRFLAFRLISFETLVELHVGNGASSAHRRHIRPHQLRQVQPSLSLPNGQCRNDPNESALNIDCTAHSVKYDVATNTFRALFVQTDVWCSSGAVMPDDRLIQTGGFNDAERRVRIFTPCANLVSIVAAAVHFGHRSST